VIVSLSQIVHDPEVADVKGPKASLQKWNSVPIAIDFWDSGWAEKAFLLTYL
jgi:hypothetical protein